MSRQTSLMPDGKEIPTRASKKKKVKKPYVIQWKTDRFHLWNEWSTYKRYADKKVAEEVLTRKQKNDTIFQYRLIGPMA